MSTKNATDADPSPSTVFNARIGDAGADGVKRSENGAILPSSTWLERMPRRLSFVEYSSFDLRCFARFALFITAWRYLSSDFRALPLLVREGNRNKLLPAWLDSVVTAGQRIVYDTVSSTLIWQFVVVLLVILALFMLRRGILVVATAAAAFTELSLWHFRYSIGELDMVIFLLALICCVPGRIYASSSRACTREASLLGLVMVMYVGAIYFMAGIAKVQLGRPWWWDTLHLEQFTYAMVWWHGSQMPDWIQPMRSAFLGVAKLPGVSVFLGILTVVIEAAWVLAAFSRISRIVMPPLVWGMHAMIFVTTGICFVSLAFTAFALVVPYRLILPGKKSEEGTGDASGGMATSYPEALRLGIAAVAFVLFMTPYFTYMSNPFGLNWGVYFNFNNVEGEHDVYRLGYQRPDGKFEPMPFNHSGFMDYIVPSSFTGVVSTVAALPAAERPAVIDSQLRPLLLTLRPNNSNAWLLGPLCLPNHVVAKSKPMSLARGQPLHLLKGHLSIQGSKVKARWKSIGTVPLPVLATDMESWLFRGDTVASTP